MCDKFKFELKKWNKLSFSKKFEIIDKALIEREKWIEYYKFNFEPIIHDYIEKFKL